MPVPIANLATRTPRRRFERWVSIALLIAVAGGSGCNRSDPEDLRDVVAIVEGVPITAEQLSREMERRTPGSQPSSAAATRDAVLTEMIRNRALLHRARTEGLDRDPETLRRIDRVVVARYLEAHSPDPEKIPAPTDDEIRGLYEARRSDFVTPERIRIGMIVLRGSSKATPEKTLERRQRAELLRAGLLEKVSTPDAFAECARQHSDDRATRYQGGDVGWVELDRKGHPWPVEVVEAMSRLRADEELSPVIETAAGCYLLKLLGRQAAGIRPLDEVRDEIVHRRVLDEKRSLAAGFEERLHAGLQIEIRSEAVARVPLPEPRLARSESQPPSLPAR